MGVTLHNLKAGSPRDEAMRNLTKEAANLYAKRVLRELIQNAFDGAANAEEPRILLRLDLRQGEHGTLYVANNGRRTPPIRASRGVCSRSCWPQNTEAIGATPAGLARALSQDSVSDCRQPSHVLYHGDSA